MHVFRTTTLHYLFSRTLAELRKGYPVKPVNARDMKFAHTVPSPLEGRLVDVSKRLELGVQRRPLVTFYNTKLESYPLTVSEPLREFNAVWNEGGAGLTDRYMS